MLHLWFSNFCLKLMAVLRHVSYKYHLHFQAPTLEVKEFWVKEIKKVLMGQFDAIKCEYKISWKMFCKCSELLYILT